MSRYHVTAHLGRVGVSGRPWRPTGLPLSCLSQKKKPITPRGIEKASVNSKRAFPDLLQETWEAISLMGLALGGLG